MSSDSTPSQYIPKFIQNIPWYYKLRNTETSTASNEDGLAHQRKHSLQTNSATNATVDSLDDYDAKRDHWQGNADAEWNTIVKDWDNVKEKSMNNSALNEDSDDTDYELELEELGLDRKHLKSNHLEDPGERANRDRHDVPAYIMGITTNEGGKIRYGQDSLATIIHQDSDFVRESKDEADFKKIQTFAWEKNKQHERELLMKLYKSEVTGEQAEGITQANLDYIVEASPTLMMMQARAKEKKAREESEKRLKKLKERYGS